MGLGYVGLPVAHAFAGKFEKVIGFDVSQRRIAELRDGHDNTGELTSEQLANVNIDFTDNPEHIKAADFIVVAVPTPVDHNRAPDFAILRAACRTVGANLQSGAIVVFESTVYPGATEEICAPELEAASGLKAGTDFKLGYSPERINPGDKEHPIEAIVKVVSGQDSETLEIVAAKYEAIIDAGVHRASSIKVAEAAKVLENTQRDVNIALMNELAKITRLAGIRTADVLEAAGTKWNFLRFNPGLVGGHCIGVDPYYLTSKAEQLGYHPEVILSGRRINDGMPRYIATEVLQLLATHGFPIRRARIGVLGATFKENVPDVRNSKAAELVLELKKFGMQVMASDPHAPIEQMHEEYGIELVDCDQVKDLDAIIIAVPHHAYLNDLPALIRSKLNPRGLLVDLKSALNPADFLGEYQYWSL
ncbi:nucleotide sugar dehydrogenase [Novosphingobium sp. PhB57]|uniref:nucleotide sugar dehydrogenase n=1 Tax=Novosphingobium sp. PhB57 TaxID=2485107 RepID=UPI001FB34DD3|nr:nucleotide sugar dehydrogenase [Novosphingobium sp. PhB57]